MRKLNIIISGGTGFIGRNLLGNLGNLNAEIFVLKRRTTNTDQLSIRMKNLNFFTLDDSSFLEHLISSKGKKLFLHLATCYGRNGETEAEVEAVNYKLGWFMLGLAMKAPGSQFFNFDTALPKHANLYAKYKHKFITECDNLTQKRNFNFVNIVLQNVYGPGDSSSGLIPSVINACLNNHRSIDLSHGSQRRDFVFIEDAVRAIYTIITKLKSIDDGIFRNISISTGSTFSIIEVAELIKELTKSKIDLNFGAIKKNNIYDENLMVGDVKEISSLGWKPLVDLRDGLHKTIIHR